MLSWGTALLEQTLAIGTISKSCFVRWGNLSTALVQTMLVYQSADEKGSLVHFAGTTILIMLTHEKRC